MKDWRDYVDELERSFFDTHCYDGRYGKYTFLMRYFISSFRTQNTWKDKILPYLEGLRQKTASIDDWNEFSDKGIDTILFRYEHVMFMSNDIPDQKGIIRYLKDENGDYIRDRQGQNALVDSDYIEAHYSAYCKVPLDEFIEICKLWLELIQKWRK